MGAIPTTKRLIPTVYSLDQKALYIYKMLQDCHSKGKPVPCYRDRSLSSGNARLLMNNTVGVVVEYANKNNSFIYRILAILAIPGSAVPFFTSL